MSTRRPFAAVLADLDAGQLVDALEDRLAQVIEAVVVNCNTGKLTLDLTVKPNGKTQVTIDSAIKTKLPEPERSTTHMFVDDEYGLCRRDPRQSEMELRRVTSIDAVRQPETEE